MNFLPKFGSFTNGMYVVTGVVIFRRLIGKVVHSNYPQIHQVGDWVNWPHYRNKTTKKPQFIKKSKFNSWYYEEEIDWHKF